MKSSIYSSGLFWALVFAFGGFLIYANNMGMVPETLKPFWPVIFIIMGLVGIVEYMDSTKVTGVSKPSSKTSGKTTTKKAVKKARR